MEKFFGRAIGNQMRDIVNIPGAQQQLQRQSSDSEVPDIPEAPNNTVVESNGDDTQVITDNADVDANPNNVNNDDAPENQVHQIQAAIENEDDNQPFALVLNHLAEYIDNSLPLA